MIVYRKPGIEVALAAELARLHGAAKAGDTLDLLVRLGEVEQAVVDALYPRVDGWGPAASVLRRSMLRVGAAYLASHGGTVPPGDLHDTLAELHLLDRPRLPKSVIVKVPEGFAHYAIDPIGYAHAARRHRHAVGAERAARSIVIGVRSIGTTLSALVAAALGTERSITVRPRGESGARQIFAVADLTDLLGAWLAEGAEVLIVDEGPGATGETLDVVASWVRSLGVVDERIVLFPSRTWGMPLAPERRRVWFERARKAALPPADERTERVLAAFGLERPEDLSGGAWRPKLRGAWAIPACTGHERLKHRARRPDDSVYLLRFAGLGRWGEAALQRAMRLSETGVGPEVVGLREGFLARRWLDGVPAYGGADRDPDFAAALSDYLTRRVALFGTGRAVERAPLLELLRVNAIEGLGGAVPGLTGALERLERLPDREAAVPDGRLQLREWVVTPDGYRKVDAIDHGDGLRFPGPTDRAWDLAAAAVEFGIGGDVLTSLIRRCAAAAGESALELAAAVDAYRPVYAALHLGDSALNAHEAESPVDRVLWRAEEARYRLALARELAPPRGVDSRTAVA